MFSIIIPVLNEAEEIESRLESIQFFRKNGHEIILADGGSTDGTINLAKPYVDSIVSSQVGRAAQMNAGALNANGNNLFFLHIDSILPEEICDELSLFDSQNIWGFCRIRLSGKHCLFRLIETMMNLRSRITFIATGDQGLIISKVLFEKIGGYPSIDLMEDVEICKCLKRLSNPVVINSEIETSSRRWEERGIIKTIILMWYLRLLYFFGVSPKRLVKIYYSRG